MVIQSSFLSIGHLQLLGFLKVYRLAHLRGHSISLFLRLLTFLVTELEEKLSR